MASHFRRLWRVFAIALLLVVVLAGLNHARNRQLYPAQYAFNDLHSEFRNRPKPWDEPTRAAYAQGCLDIAQRYPESYVGFETLRSAVDHGSQPALELFGKRLGETPIEIISETLIAPQPNYRPLAPALLDRAMAEPNHPKTPRLLGIVCRLSTSLPTDQPPPEFITASDELIRSHPQNPAAADVAKAVIGQEVHPPQWAGAVEPKLRQLMLSPNDSVRRWATFAVCRILDQSERKDSNVELAALLATIADWPTEPDSTGDYSTGIVIAEMAEKLKSGICDLPAPETEGVDLDGHLVRLVGYRGRVVLVAFWGSWCPPCVAMIPHEVKLAQKYAGRPFAILGINCDEDPAKGRLAAAKLGVTWPSIAHGATHIPGRKRLGDIWQAKGIPLVCVVDASGIVRYRRNDKPSETELETAIESQVAAAEQSR